MSGSARPLEETLSLCRFENEVTQALVEYPPNSAQWTALKLLERVLQEDAGVSVEPTRRWSERVHIDSTLCSYWKQKVRRCGVRAYFDLVRSAQTDQDLRHLAPKSQESRRRSVREQIVAIAATPEPPGVAAVTPMLRYIVAIFGNFPYLRMQANELNRRIYVLLGNIASTERLREDAVSWIWEMRTYGVSRVVVDGAVSLVRPELMQQVRAEVRQGQYWHWHAILQILDGVEQLLRQCMLLENRQEVALSVDLKWILEVKTRYVEFATPCFQGSGAGLQPLTEKGQSGDGSRVHAQSVGVQPRSYPSQSAQTRELDLVESFFGPCTEEDVFAKSNLEQRERVRARVTEEESSNRDIPGLQRGQQANSWEIESSALFHGGDE
jgi:hypothetical protein